MQFLTAGDKQLEYMWYGPRPDEAPTLVFLHEGLGCVSMWRDFPQRLVDATGCGGLVFSRAGYGNSDPINLPRPVRFMHDEALITLPQVLDLMEIRQTILVGHSDGGSIALIHAGGTRDSRLRGLILEAPHVFVEEFGLARSREIAEEYRNGQLRSRLERYHGENVDCAFWGWNDIWLNPEFAAWNIEEYLPGIEVPTLLIQGEDDQYGTLEHVRRIEAGGDGLVKAAILADCGHSPHLDQPAQTLELMTRFVWAVLRGDLAANDSRQESH